MRSLFLLLQVGAFLAVAAIGASAGAQQARPAQQSCLTALSGAWRGPGVVLGRSIVMDQRWEPVISGAFTELTMRHFASDSSTRPSFEGRGFYRIVGTRAPDSLAGTWLDMRGLTFSIAGKCVGTTMSSHWSGATERGRTMYVLDGDELIVIDSVFPASGGGREFGRSRLRRSPR
jgi:hypothetical protein